MNIAARSRRETSDEFSTEFVIQPPDDTAFVIGFAAILDHEHKVFGYLSLYQEADAAVRHVGDETILRLLARIANDAAGAVHDLTR